MNVLESPASGGQCSFHFQLKKANPTTMISSGDDFQEPLLDCYPVPNHR